MDENCATLTLSIFWFVLMEKKCQTGKHTFYPVDGTQGESITFEVD